MENPCANEDMTLFYAATTILVENGENTLFFGTPLAKRCKTKRHCSPIFFDLQKEKWNMKSALHDNKWITKVNLTDDFTSEHLEHFMELWV